MNEERKRNLISIMYNVITYPINFVYNLLRNNGIIKSNEETNKEETK